EPVIFYIAVIFGLLTNIWSYYYGDRIITFLTGAKEVNKNDLPEVYRILENLSITAGLPKTPKLYLINTPAMNAFATGRNPENSLVAVTSGLINNLSKEEIEGVIAHEISHIKNRDIKVMMIATILAGIIAIMADLFLRFGLYSSSDRENKGNVILFLIGFILALLAPIFAQLIQLAISRKREFMADASGALITKNPLGLASALEKISKQNIPMGVSPATASLFIVNPFKDKKGFVNWLGNLFSTHPPVEERIKRLKEMIL
ncbi:MAG: M48 family metallopeptidase, partial [Candidatus Bathyarchaeia archaeon]